MYWNAAILIYVFPSFAHHQLEAANIPQKVKKQSKTAMVNYVYNSKGVDNNDLSQRDDETTKGIKIF